MAMIDNFIDAFDEYVQPRVGQTNNFSKLLDEAHNQMVESFKKGDVYNPHTFSADDQKEIRSYIDDVKKQGPKAYVTETPAPTPKPKVEPETKAKPVDAERSTKPKLDTEVKPSIAESKVGDAETVIKEKVVSETTQTKTAPPAPPKSPTVPDELPKVKTDVPDLKKSSSFLKENRGKIALGALGFGLAKSVIDKEDDDVLSSTGKAIKTGLVATGMAVAGEHLMKNETLQDVVRGEVIENAKKVRNADDIEAAMLKGRGIGGKAFKIGLMAVGAATVLDVGQKTKEHFDSEKIKKKQEFELENRRKRSKEKQREMSYGSMRDGEIVFEMFNARTGHHKMGNAKFN